MTAAVPERPDWGSLREACRVLTGVAEQVTRADHGRSTPCPGMSVLDLLAHLVGWHEVFMACARGAVPPIENGSPTYRGGCDTVGDLMFSTDAVQDALRLAPACFEVPYRAWVALETLVSELTAETVLHSWDLAMAVGCGLEPSQDLLAAADVGLSRLRGESFAPDAFGSPVELDGPALSLDGLVARSGRDPAWSPAGAGPNRT